MEFWIARDDDMELYLYNEQPKLNRMRIWSVSTESGKSYRLDSDLFSEVTLENSPKRVELKLIEE